MKTGSLLRLGVALAALILGWTAYLFIRAQLLELRFRDMHPDQTEARLLEVVGKPTEIRRCDEGSRKIVKRDAPGASQCAKVYWYSTWPFPDGWLVPIDDTGVIMQIDRKGLP